MLLLVGLKIRGASQLINSIGMMEAERRRNRGQCAPSSLQDGTVAITTLKMP